MFNSERFPNAKRYFTDLDKINQEELHVFMKEGLCIILSVSLVPEKAPSPW